MALSQLASRSAWLPPATRLTRLRQRSKHHLLGAAVPRRLLNTDTGALPDRRRMRSQPPDIARRVITAPLEYLADSPS